MYEDRSPSGKPCRQLTEGFRSGWILGEKLTGSSGEPTKKGYFPKDYCVSHAESGALAVAGLFWPPVWNEELHFELASATGEEAGVAQATKARHQAQPPSTMQCQ